MLTDHDGGEKTGNIVASDCLFQNNSTVKIMA